MGHQIAGVTLRLPSSSSDIRQLSAPYPPADSTQIDRPDWGPKGMRATEIDDDELDEMVNLVPRLTKAADDDMGFTARCCPP